MLKKDITFDDLDGNPVTETFWFNLSKGEMTEMAVGKEGAQGGFDAWIRKMIASNDGEVLIREFKQMLLKTIGERAPDNIQFIKNDQIRQRFEQSDAYSTLLMELLTDMDKMTAFINGVIPAKMRDGTDPQLKAVLEKQETVTADNSKVVDSEEPIVGPQTPSGVSSANVEPTKDERPEWLKEGRIPTNDELKGATPEQIIEAFRRKSEDIGSVIHNN